MVFILLYVPEVYVRVHYMARRSMPLSFRIPLRLFRESRIPLFQPGAGTRLAGGARAYAPASTPPLDDVGLGPAESGTTRPFAAARSRVAMNAISTLIVPGSFETGKLARLGAIPSLKKLPYTRSSICHSWRPCILPRPESTRSQTPYPGASVRRQRVSGLCSASSASSALRSSGRCRPRRASGRRCPKRRACRPPTRPAGMDPSPEESLPSAG